MLTELECPEVRSTCAHQLYQSCHSCSLTTIQCKRVDLILLSLLLLLLCGVVGITGIVTAAVAVIVPREKLGDSHKVVQSSGRPGDDQLLQGRQVVPDKV